MPGHLAAFTTFSVENTCSRLTMFCMRIASRSAGPEVSYLPKSLDPLDEIREQSDQDSQ
jgi:hypothetical protein